MIRMAAYVLAAGVIPVAGASVVVSVLLTLIIFLLLLLMLFILLVLGLELLLLMITCKQHELQLICIVLCLVILRK